MFVSVPIQIHGYMWRGRLAHHLSIEAGKSTWTKLKHLDNLTFCSQIPSKGRDLWGPVPTWLHTEGGASTQAGSRKKHPDATTAPTHHPIPKREGIRALLLIILICTSFPWFLVLVCSSWEVLSTRTSRRAHGGAAFEWEADAVPFFCRHLLQPCCYLKRNVWAGRPRGD